MLFLSVISIRNILPEKAYVFYLLTLPTRPSSIFQYDLWTVGKIKNCVTFASLGNGGHGVGYSFYYRTIKLSNYQTIPILRRAKKSTFQYKKIFIKKDFSYRH
jgi:hypothetical protein